MTQLSQSCHAPHRDPGDEAGLSSQSCPGQVRQDGPSILGFKVGRYDDSVFVLHNDALTGQCVSHLVNIVLTRDCVIIKALHNSLAHCSQAPFSLFKTHREQAARQRRAPPPSSGLIRNLFTDLFPAVYTHLTSQLAGLCFIIPRHPAMS